MRKYNVTVNGTTYEVEVEEIGEGVSASAPAPEQKAAAPAPKAAPAAGGNTVKAPMPGTILNMNVKVGDKIEKDALVCVLEAMKMENEIFSTSAGTVKAINAPKGTTVNSGDAIITLE